MTYNEADIIEEMMRHNRGMVDTIFVLDGSDDGTDRLLQGFPEVELILKDADVAPGARVRDHHRQALLDAARERHGHGHWFTLMHGDEFFHDDARAVAEAAHKQGAARVNWAAMQFFMHESDEPLDVSLPVQQRLTWYSPFWVEIRQFRDDPRAAYRAGEHGRVFPRGVGWRPYSRMPIVKHYPYRDPDQMRARLQTMESRGFSGTAAETAVYRPTYAQEYKVARRFEGDFGELETDRQGGLLRMMWRWRRWVRV